MACHLFGEDTPPDCLGTWVLDIIMWLWRCEWRKICTAASPGLPIQVTRGPLSSWAPLIDEFPSASAIQPGPAQLTDGHWAGQGKAGGSSNHKQVRKVEEKSLEEYASAGWRGVFEGEHECQCVCLGAFLQLCFFISLSPNLSCYGIQNCVACAVWDLTKYSSWIAVYPTNDSLDTPGNKVIDYENMCNWVHLDKSMDLLRII